MKKIMICLSQLMLLLLLLGAKKVYAMDCYFLTINAIENNSSCKKNIEDVESVFRRNQLKGYSEKQKYFNYTYNCEGIGSTKSEFDAALDLAFSKSTTNDRIVLYYTGHGRMEQKSNNELRGTGLELGNDYYPYEDLAKKICSYKCKYAVIMLEACGSGAFIDEAKKMPQAKSKMVVFTASKAEEKARYRKKWFNDLPYSRFTNALTAGLKNPTFYADMIKKDGSVTAEELFSYIKVVMGQDLLNWKIKDEEVVSAWKDQTPMAYYGNKNFAVFQYTKLSLNKSSLPFKQIGTYSTLKAKITGVQDTVKWTSDNTSVATVNSKGVVIAKSAGAAKITATCNRAKAVCTVIVSKQTSPVKINKTSTTILAGSSVTLKATYNGKKPKKVTWSTSDENVAKVSSKGKVTGEKEGFVTITATVNGKKASCVISVKTPVKKITLNQTSASITKGKTLTLKASVSPSNATKKTIMWTSSNKKVATVTSKGVVKGVAYGTVTITAKAADGSGKKATCKVMVKSAASAVPNVTDKVLKMSMVDAAKYLGFTQRIVQGNMVYYTHKGKTIRGYRTTDNSSFMESYKSFEKKKGLWNIIITDKTISFYGAKVGMKKDVAHKKIINYKWHVSDEQGYSDGEYDIWYENSAYNQFNVVTQNGVVKGIEYIPVDD